MTLLSGRVKIATALGDRQRSMLKGRKPTAAVLVKRRDGQYFLHVPHDRGSPRSDRRHRLHRRRSGHRQHRHRFRRQPALGQADVEKIRRKHNLQRKRLQRKDTKGARRNQADARQGSPLPPAREPCISKAIVETAKGTGRGIALEDLEGIRERVTARGGDARNRLSGWAFAQLGALHRVQGATGGSAGRVCRSRRTPARRVTSAAIARSPTARARTGSFARRVVTEANADVNAARNIRARAVSRNAAPEPGTRSVG